MSRLLVCAVVAVCLVGSLARAASPGWWDGTFDDAMATAVAQERTLVVWVTSDGACGMCDAMERETWGSEEVRSWIADQGVVVRYVLGSSEELDRRLRVDFAPTTIFFRGPIEFERSLGVVSEAEFLGHVGALDSIEHVVRLSRRSTTPEQYRAQLEQADEDYDRASILERFADAHPEEAGPSVAAFVRELASGGHVEAMLLLDFMGEEALRAAASSPESAEALAELQQELAVRVARIQRLDDASLYVFGRLSMVRDDGERLALWIRMFDARKRSGEVIIQNQVLAWFALHELLLEAGRYDLAVTLNARQAAEKADDLILLVGRAGRDVADLMDSLMPEDASEDIQQLLEGLKTKMNDETRERVERQVPGIYAALLDAEEDDYARGVGLAVIRRTESAELRLGLVEQALEVGQAREYFGDWLQEAVDLGADPERATAARERLEKMLGE